ncbi:MAG TPA: ribbon-helix-helix protein, CopG family [Thermoanaerobaculia bacterium]|nr:ribbon-helix-helix protein, CopG family [Thermoanaerobaculia bacterium]
MSVVRTTVNLTPEAVEAVREMARERGTTVADVIRRAIWIEKYLHETLKAGGKVLLEDAAHGVRELVIR